MPEHTDLDAHAGDILDSRYDERMDVPAFTEYVLDNPDHSHVVPSAQYLLDAIKAEGTRTVVEAGEEKERYKFFDDPHNDGEHAVLGNTEVLNDWVRDLESRAQKHGDKEDSMFWFVGPTASGKSEFKRCLINGLREYSKTEQGRRYTLEMNVDSVKYPQGDNAFADGGRRPSDADWAESPVQSIPLMIYPDETVDEFYDRLNEEREGDMELYQPPGLDPLMKRGYEMMFNTLHREGHDGQQIMSAITDEGALKVRNYIVDIGNGIGVLHSEDEGRPKQLLVGSWQNRISQEPTWGQRDPQEFTFDGILSQGQNGLTIIEDAIQHKELVRKLLNVADENAVKLSTGIPMEIDSQIMLISNPDLEAELTKAEERGQEDPYRKLRRRLDQYRLKYLTEYRTEEHLIRRAITNDTEIQQPDDFDAAEELVRAPCEVVVSGDEDEEVRREIAPHALESSAMYDVISRLSDDLPEPSEYDGDDIPDAFGDLTYTEKAQLYDQGFLEIEDVKLEKADFDWDEDKQREDGKDGIPVTFTTVAIANLLQEEFDRKYDDVIMPRDVLGRMDDEFNEQTVIGDEEADEYREQLDDVLDYLHGRQQEDVLEALLHGQRATEDAVRRYVNHVAKDLNDDQVQEDGKKKDPDRGMMQQFEVDHLGKFSDDDYQRDGTPKDHVVEWRQNNIATPIAERGFAGDTPDPEELALELPVIERLMGDDNWDDVERIYVDDDEEFEPKKWLNPTEGTATERIKERAVDNLIDLFDYSPESAELTSWHVLVRDFDPMDENVDDPYYEDR